MQCHSDVPQGSSLPVPPNDAAIRPWYAELLMNTMHEPLAWTAIAAAGTDEM